ncbi:MAG: electron transfer flavoprotein subunit alpha/FixB family protein [Phycisphaerae bacterium]|nr:electron transfer flavoprotein subunit alpha/FixB family protein [Phycisphaerae bacterium]
MSYEGVWILAEQRHGRVQTISHELLTRGIDLAAKRKVSLTALLIGSDVKAADLQELIDRGADRVVVVEDQGLEHFLPEAYARVMQAMIAKYRPEIIIAGATSLGRTLMPYVAVKCHAGLTADCTVLDIEPETGNLLQTRPAIGGNILATIKTPEARPQMATVRPKSTRPAPKQSGRKGEIVRESADASMLASRVRMLDFVKNEDEVSISDAQRVVAGGRGFKTSEKFKQVYELADALQAAVGASRDAVDRAWITYPHQVGLSGKTVTPDLYLAVGISGAIQHLAGMQTAETIIAINNDPDAQIFSVADYGIVGDLNEVVPALTEKLKARK